MSYSQKNYLHKLIGYRPPRLTTGKSCWYIGFYAFDPLVGKLRQKRIKLNHINPILDVVFMEDMQRKRDKNAAQNFAIVRKIVFNLLKKTKVKKV
jgi:hypothetical protein